jgi:sulfate adenylyltransferase subunit 1
MTVQRENIPGVSGEDRGVLRFLTCGSVDDGKSTLIGRLLFDSRALLTDTLATLRAHADRRGLSAPDLSTLTDGLIAEREQGITIDVAYRYFATAQRKFIIADSPGHEQYTRNMVTAASTADVAILLVDARAGIQPQTRRHAMIAAMLGIGRLILAVNKMDLVDWSQQRFDAIATDLRGWLRQHPELAGVDLADALTAIPVSALLGDMVVDRGAHLAWYAGPTLIEMLEQSPVAQSRRDAPMRFPVQWVCKPDQVEQRGYTGRIEAGELRVGDPVQIAASGQRTKVTRITLGETELTHAVAGQSIQVWLADRFDISRGDMLTHVSEEEPRREFIATLCWLNPRPMMTSRSYALRHTTREVKAKIDAIEGRLDLSALAWQAGDSVAEVGLNDLVRVRIKTQKPLLIDSYRDQRSTGSFILIDEATNETVAAAVVA